MKDRFRDFCWPHQVERPRTGWLSHFRWIASIWLLLVFRDRVGLRQATFAAFEYLRDALTDRPIKRLLVNTQLYPATITLPPGTPGMEYWIKNLGPHPVTLEGAHPFSSLDIKNSSWVKMIKKESGWAVRP